MQLLKFILNLEVSRLMIRPFCLLPFLSLKILTSDNNYYILVLTLFE